MATLGTRMAESVQLWIYGTAAVVDTVLLFALVERHNWRAVTIWMLMLALGVWMWHGGVFVRQLVEHSVGPLADPVRWLSMMSMALGLLLMPSAALHGAWRLLMHGQFRIGPSPDPRMLLCYIPLLMLIPMGDALAAKPSAPFLDVLTAYHIAYAIWLCLVSGIAAFGLLRAAAGPGSVPMRRFHQSLAGSMVLIAVLVASFVATWPRFPALQMIVGISPVIPVLLFAYFVMRFQLLPMILERALVYGVVLMGVMLFHALVLKDAVSAVEKHYRLDFGIIEGTLVLAIILLYQPLRDRVAAALQSLVDSTSRARSQRRRLSVQLAARAGDSPAELLVWFTNTMQETIGTDLAAAWLCDGDGRIIHRAGSADVLSDDNVQQLMTSMAASGEQFITRYSVISSDLLQLLDHVRAGAVLWFHHANIRGLFLIGCRQWGQPPNEEDLHALSLLVEQFGVTLQNSQLQAMQLAAEHRTLHQEKLSALGLLASSLAHEIKNPLSSIKTITQVLAEDLGPDSPHAEDLRMIAGEIDRLADSTSELLDAARPPKANQTQLLLTDLLSPTLRLLKLMAREHQVTLEVRLPDEPELVACDQVSLREIVFNLISNGVQAAGSDGSVVFECRSERDLLVMEIIDTGPGISAELQNRLFEPFFTTKPTGTGLGLFVVARRVRELGGDIQCHSQAGQATRFQVRLPRTSRL